MTVATGLYACLYLLTGLIALDKWRSVGWRPRGAIERASCLNLTLATLYLLVICLDPVWAFIDRTAGIPNVYLLVAASLLALQQKALQVLVEDRLRRYAGPPGRWRRALSSPWLPLGMVALATILFAAAPVHQTGTLDYAAFIARYATAPLVPAFIAALWAYPAAVLSQLFYLTLRWASTLPTADLRRRARLWLGGTAALLALIAHEFVYLTLRRLGATYDHAADVRFGLSVAGPGLAMSGGLIDFGLWVSRYRAYRHLGPLLEALRRATPDVATRAHGATGPGITNLELRLQARATEIRDRRLALLRGVGVQSVVH